MASHAVCDYDQHGILAVGVGDAILVILARPLVAALVDGEFHVFDAIVILLEQVLINPVTQRHQQRFLFWFGRHFFTQRFL